MSDKWMPGMTAPGKPKSEAPAPPVAPPPPPAPEPDEAADSTPDAGDGYPEEGNIGDVVEWVGDDPARRDFALAAEQDRETPRKGVIEELGGD